MRQLLLIILSTLLMVYFANAHSPLTSSVPSTSQTVPAAFDSFQFTFGESAKLVKITIQTEAGAKTELDLSNNSTPQKEHIVKSEPLAPGFYTVYWRALSNDGHPIKGSIPFKVR
ncbi:MAG: copper resistance protein CopC [Rhizobiaceae bacterium]|nr:copper resistance protein CopC [Rhizobiaceae bacterium]